MADENQRTTPLPKSTQFDDKSEAEPLSTSEAEQYRELIGDLRYLADSTMLEIALESARLARNFTKTTTTHWNLTKYFLRYLKATITHGILYTNHNNEPLTT